MGFVGDLLGGGSSGSGFKAGAANIEKPVNGDQATLLYNQSLGGLDKQLAFYNALQGQNGIQNQSNVYNQLAGVANGTGPNPALQQLQNTTGQNVANQAALMAGQRGSGANAGLLARQAAMQGGNLQQQAVGQGAALQAQQQLAALSAMGGLANQQVSQQGSALSGYNSGSQGEQNLLLNAMANYNNSSVAQNSNINTSNAGIASVTAQGQQGLLGGALGGAGAAFGLFKNKGGMIRNYDNGGFVDPGATSSSLMEDQSGPQSFAGNFLKQGGGGPFGAMGGNPGALALNKGLSNFGGGLGSLGSSLFGSAGGAESVAAASPSLINSAADIGMLAFEKGNVVPGKASVKGDSLKNDTVPAMLSPGEVVIPRHVMQSKDPVKGAADFVAAVLAKKGKKNALRS